MKSFNVLITGCQYNYYDAKNIAHLMQKMGYIYNEDDNTSDVIIVLSCSVRQKPIDRIFGKINKWQKLPQKPKIVMLGCVLDSDKKKFAKKIDLITNIDNFEKDIKNVLDKNDVELVSDEVESFYPKNEPKNTSYVPIMQGCDNFCTYCAVPYTRGREKSRKEEDILDEVKSNIKSGSKHIILLGQNVNKFKQVANSRQQTADSIDKIHAKNNDFLKLIKEVDKLKGDFDYNFISANPMNFSEELIDFLPNAKKWNKHLHLPLQSGNDEILKKMNRNYTVSDYLHIVKKLKTNCKKLKLTTDIIVGFPGETDKQFDDTYELCKEAGYDGAYIAQYSPRDGTYAQKKYEDDIPRSVKKARWAKLNKLVNN